MEEISKEEKEKISYGRILNLEKRIIKLEKQNKKKQ